MRGIFLETYNQTESFEKRYWQELRRRSAASDIGHLALSSEIPWGYEKRRREELIDGIAEAIPGIVRNTRCYELVDGVLVADDGQTFESLLLAGLQNSIKLANQDSFYQQFGPQRAKHELDEAKNWQAMASGQVSYNTAVTYSPYSEEFCKPETIEKIELSGQDPKNKRAMLRIGHWDGNKLHVITRSIDNVDVSILKETSILANGYDFLANDSTAMLGERQNLIIDINQAYELADKIIDQADKLITAKLGQETIQGRLISEAYDTQNYVESQKAIIDELLSKEKLLAAQHNSYESYEIAWRQELHKYIALLKEMMLSGSSNTPADIATAANAAGAIAAARNESYNMCGLIISASGSIKSSQDLYFESVKSLYGKKVQCPECKKKVTVPSVKLNEGKLCCPKCQYEVDVCTGKIFRKSNKNKKTKQLKQSLPRKETDWQRIVRQDQEKKAARKLALKNRQNQKIA